LNDKINEQKKLESEENYRNLYEEAPNAYFSIGIDKSIIQCNKAAENLLGYSRNELLKMKVFDLYFDSENGLTKAKVLFEQYLEGTAIQDEELQMKAKDEKPLWVSLSVSPIMNDQGRVIESRSMVIDISKRKKAEKRLEESEEKYRKISERYEKLLESITDAVYVIDWDWVYTLVNKLAEKIVNMPVENLLGHKITEVFPGIEETKFFKTYETVMKKRKPKRVRDSFTLPDGQTGYYEVSVYPISEGILCIGRNISEEVEAEQKLKESETRLLYAQRIARLGFWDWNIITGELYWSDEAYRMFGFKPQEFAPSYEKFMSVVQTDDLKFVQEHIDAALQNDVKYNIDLRIVRPSGEVRYVDAQGDITRDSNGKAIRFVGTQIDITERKKTEQKLKESEEKYRSLFETSRDAISILDMDGNIENANQAYLDMFGYSLEEVKSVPLRKRIPEKWFNREMGIVNNQIMKRGYSDEYEREGIRKDSTIFPVSIRTWLVKDNKGAPKYFMGIIRDITEKKDAERRLKKSEANYRDAFERAEFYKDLFAHDISNILQNIQSSLGLLSIWRDDPEKIKDTSEIMSILNDQVIRGSKLVSNIRKLSEISETGGLLEDVETLPILKDAIKFIHNSFPEKDIKIKFDSEIDKASVKANALVLDVFENILFNAVRYNDDPHIEISTRVSKEIKDHINYIKFEFIDNGIGVPDVMKARIFRGLTERKEKVQGMGLGLLLVKGIISNYNGHIWVEDKIKGDPSKGSNFIILIPEVI